MKMSRHWLVVGYAVEIVALYDVVKFVGHLYLSLFNNIIVFYSVQYDIGGYYRDFAHLIVGEEAVGNLYKSLCAELLAFKVVSDGHVAAD
jgi:hypothetical protein